MTGAMTQAVAELLSPDTVTPVAAAQFRDVDRWAGVFQPRG